MKVKLKTVVRALGGDVGDIVDVPPFLAETWIARGDAEPVGAKQKKETRQGAETAVAVAPVETREEEPAPAPEPEPVAEEEDEKPAPRPPRRARKE